MSNKQKELIQRIFEDTTISLLKQGSPSLGPDPDPEADDPKETMCLYRGQDGKKCAIGHLIDDDFYSEGLENHTVSSLRVWPSIVRSIQKKYNTDVDDESMDGMTIMSFFSDIQKAHDEDLRRNVFEYKIKISQIGKKYDLSTSFMAEFQL